MKNQQSTQIRDGKQRAEDSNVPGSRPSGSVTGTEPAMRMDRRLNVSNTRDVTATLSFKDGTTLDVDVFSMSRYDVIIQIPKNVKTLETQAVLFELHCADENTKAVEGLLHWTGKTSGGHLAGIFASELIPRSFVDKTIDDRRGEIRFPVDITAFVRGAQFREEARVIDYSLNGLGLELFTPMELDRRYEATLTIDGQMLKLPMLCCYNAALDNGRYLSGVGLGCHEGALFACKAFKPSELDPNSLSVSPRFPSLNQATGRGETLEVADPGAGPYDLLVSWFNKNAKVHRRERPVVSRMTILILSSVLFGMSLRTVGTMKAATLTFGLFGVVAYFGLHYAARAVQNCRNDEATRIRREIAERRLTANVSKYEADTTA